MYYDGGLRLPVLRDASGRVAIVAGVPVDPSTCPLTGGLVTVTGFKRGDRYHKASRTAFSVSHFEAPFSLSLIAVSIPFTVKLSPYFMHHV